MGRVAMHEDEVWRAIDPHRLCVADLLDQLTEKGLLLLLTGRLAAIPPLSGDGAAALGARLALPVR